MKTNDVAGQRGVLRFEDRNKISDFYIPLARTDNGSFEATEASFSDAYAYTGSPQAKLVWDGQDPKLTKWLVDVYLKSDAGLREASNFRLEHEGVMFRAHRARTVNGYELALRALPAKAPGLEQLRMDPRVRAMLMSSHLLYGGLVIVAAANGQGKTTTISATVKSRLERFAGHCNAVEDPPELPLEGWHGNGRCVQLPVESANGPGSGYAEALVDVRRFFPAMAGGGTMLMIGEVRNAETAAETLLAAFEGHLVITTFHGSSIPHALMRFATLATEKMGEGSARELMAATLKLCIHQKLRLHDNLEGWDRGELSSDILAIASSTSPAACAVKEGSGAKIAVQIEEQRNRLHKIDTSEAFLRANGSRIAEMVDMAS